MIATMTACPLGDDAVDVVLVNLQRNQWAARALGFQVRKVDAVVDSRGSKSLAVFLLDGAEAIRNQQPWNQRWAKREVWKESRKDSLQWHA